MLRISSLQVEHLPEGCVTDKRHPVFSWFAESDRNDNAVSAAILQAGDWEKHTKKQSGIRYRGEDLAPMTEYPVKLTVTDAFGETAEAETSFETGRMGLPFEASWITDGEYVFKEKKVSPVPMYFRREADLTKPADEVAKARLYVTALGR